MRQSTIDSNNSNVWRNIADSYPPYCSNSNGHGSHSIQQRHHQQAAAATVAAASLSSAAVVKLVTKLSLITEGSLQMLR